MKCQYFTNFQIENISVIASSLDDHSHANKDVHERCNQETLDVVYSDSISDHLQDFENRRVETLIVVVVANGWEQNTKIDYNITSLRRLILVSDPSSTAGHRQPQSEIPKPLRRWMLQSNVLDVSELTDRVDVDDVFATLLDTTFKELILGSFGLQRLGELAEWNAAILELVQSLNVTITMDSENDLSVHAIVWLYRWASRSRPLDNRKRLTLRFPVYNRWVIGLLHSFTTELNGHNNNENGVHNLHIIILDMDVDYIEILNNEERPITERFREDALVYFYENANTKTRLFVCVEDMRARTAQWFENMTDRMTLILENVEITLKFEFTKNWTRRDAIQNRMYNVNAVKTAVQNVLKNYVSNINHQIELYKQGDIVRYQALQERLFSHTMVQIELCVPEDGTSDFSEFYNAKALFSKRNKEIYKTLVRLDHIKCNLTLTNP